MARDLRLTGDARVPNQKYVVYSGDRSASPARRLDDGIPGVFREEATLPAASRAVGIGNVLRIRDTIIQRGENHPRKTIHTVEIKTLTFGW
jgi:hypothetical protein